MPEISKKKIFTFEVRKPCSKQTANESNYNNGLQGENGMESNW